MPIPRGWMRTGPILAGLACLAWGAGFAGTAEARKGGLASAGCDGCHSGGQTPTVKISASPLNPTVGSPVTLTVTISQTNGVVAGFYLTTRDLNGTFKATESGTAATTGGSGVIHTTPRSATGGVTTFKAEWTTPQAAGVEFDAYVLGGNGDGTSRGDAGGDGALSMTVGCSGIDYYVDQDDDGYGTTDPAYLVRKDCSKPPNYAAQSGDCNDFEAKIHPGATELCDGKDNNCDGKIDENVVSQLYCEDKDGDGHGVTTGASKMDCKPSVGFGDCGGDCDDKLNTVYPGATETCDLRDNNCNGNVDEGVRLICGVGWCRRYASGCTTNCVPGDPLPETCNAFDDDCDGVADNGNNQQLCGDADLACVAGRCVPAIGGTAGATGTGAGTGGGGTTGGGGSNGSLGGSGGSNGVGTGAAGGSGPTTSSGGCALADGYDPGIAAENLLVLMVGFGLVVLLGRRRTPRGQ